MPALAWHITSHLTLDRLLAPTTLERRVAARTILELPDRYGLLAFSIPDNHLHLLLQCDRRTAGMGANKAEGSLVKRLALPVGFDGAHFTPVETQSHLRNAFHYIHRQAAHHGTQGDPLRECSSLWDLLGLRTASPSLRSRVARALPRLRRPELTAHLPVPILGTAGVDAHLYEATGAVVARGSDQHRYPDLRLSRAAALQLAAADGLARDAARHLLRMTRRTAVRLIQTPAPHQIGRALRMQLHLRQTLARTRAAS